MSDRQSRRFEHYLAGAGEPFALEFPPAPRRFQVFAASVFLHVERVFGVRRQSAAE